jgi:hypothetical protein
MHPEIEAVSQHPASGTDASTISWQITGSLMNALWWQVCTLGNSQVPGMYMLAECNYTAARCSCEAGPTTIDNQAAHPWRKH